MKYETLKKSVEIGVFFLYGFISGMLTASIILGIHRGLVR